MNKSILTNFISKRIIFAKYKIIINKKLSIPNENSMASKICSYFYFFFLIEVFEDFTFTSVSSNRPKSIMLLFQIIVRIDISLQLICFYPPFLKIDFIFLCFHRLENIPSDKQQLNIVYREVQNIEFISIHLGGFVIFTGTVWSMFKDRTQWIQYSFKYLHISSSWVMNEVNNNLRISNQVHGFISLWLMHELVTKCYLLLQK